MTKEKFIELIHKLRLGDRSASEPIYNDYYSSMKATAFLILRNENDSEDAASEELLRLLIYRTHIRHPVMTYKRYVLKFEHIAENKQSRYDYTRVQQGNYSIRIFESEKHCRT